MFEVRLWKGLKDQETCSFQLNRAESIHNLWSRFTFLLIFSLILSAISAYLGIGQQSVSKLIYDYSAAEYATIKSFFGIGQMLQSLLGTTLFIFVPALLYWALTDVPFKKLLTVQLFATLITIIEKGLLLPLNLYFGLDRVSSPFSLGVVAQYMIENEWLIYFFSNITIFSIWVIILQINYVKKLSEKSMKFLIPMILLTNIFIWVFIALFSYIKFEVMF